MSNDNANHNDSSENNTCDFFSLALPCVQALHPYKPGKPIEELERELGLKNIVKLASNENPLGLSPRVLESIHFSLKEGARYPDGNGFVLRKALVDHFAHDKHVLKMDQFTLGNGSNDILELIARAFVSSDDEVIFSEYAFAVYAIVTQAIGAKAVEVPSRNWGHDLKAISAAVTSKTKLIFLANPNNPTGTAFSNEELTTFLSTIPNNVLVVLDEAYGEYIEDESFPDGVSLLGKYPNLIVSRTFSKAWGLASLRVGYAVSHSTIADILNRVRQPFNVNTFALMAAAAVLGDSEYLEKGVDLNRKGLAQLEQGLNDLGLSYIPSKGNFIAFSVVPKNNKKPKVLTGVEVFQLLLNEGVIVRPLANYKMPDFLRVSVGLPEENERFLSALKLVLSS